MPWFRTRASSSSSPLDFAGICAVIEDVCAPGHFFVRPELELAWDAVTSEEIPWEVFRGRLLDPAQTREKRAFLAWNTYEVTSAGRGTEPLLAVKLDMRLGQVHVVRGLLCRMWEGYDEGDNVILSRQAQRWVRELVGTIELAWFSREELLDELICLLWQAVVGTSRLPLHSLETPLPSFALGQLAYVYVRNLSDDVAPMRTPLDLIRRGLQADLAWREKAKLLETVLRALPDDPVELETTAKLFFERWESLGHNASDLVRLFRTLFNEVSLTPWTSFVDHVLAWWRILVQHGFISRENHMDFLAYLLIQLGRHLTAYDLVIFHHRGANYPDALLLEAVLGEFLRLLHETPQLFAEDTPPARKRRRALRQACLVRRFYEGHTVPDAPTSPGENARVLPAPFTQVPEEQVLQPAKRVRRLYEERPLPTLLGQPAREMLERSLFDLQHPAEQAELGTALFIDRPFGHGKAPGEPDQTPLLCHEAFSTTLANKRLHELELLAGQLGLGVHNDHFAGIAKQLADKPPVRGIPLHRVADPDRPVASLADARKVADDFVVVRTLPGGLADVWAQIGSESGVNRLAGRPLIVFRATEPAGRTSVVIFDTDGRTLVACEQKPGFRSRAGVEFPVEVLWHETAST